jgi:hypothetical protein
MRTEALKHYPYWERREKRRSSLYGGTGLLKSFQNYIETSDWDKGILQISERLDKICLYVVVLLGALYFPFLLKALWG